MLPADGRSAERMIERGSWRWSVCCGGILNRETMNYILRWIVCLAGLASVSVAQSQTVSDALPIDLAIVGGMNVPSFSTDDVGCDVQNKIGWQVGVLTSIKMVGVLNLEPQLIYQHQGIRLRTGDQTMQLRCNSLQLPVTASIGLARVLRIYAGPVITLVDNAKQKVGGDLIDFDRVYSTVGYTAGLRIKPQRHLMFDVRYNGQFGARKDLKQHNEVVVHKLRQYNVAISVGYLF